MPNLAEVDFTRHAKTLKKQGVVIVKHTETRLILHIPQEVECTIFQLLAEHPITRRYEEGQHIIERKSLHKSAYIEGFQR